MIRKTQFVDGRLQPAEDGAEWIVVAPHGQVWRPLHVAIGWQPYLHGQWAWTADGWFWVTDEPWGWATYHYGRWAFDPALGWFWVPGYAWAPAWVAWREGDGFVGWAPLLPGDAPWWADDYPLAPSQWIFVPMGSFVAVPVEGVAVPRARQVCVPAGDGAEHELDPAAVAGRDRAPIEHGARRDRTAAHRAHTRLRIGHAASPPNE